MSKATAGSLISEVATVSCIPAARSNSSMRPRVASQIFVVSVGPFAGRPSEPGADAASCLVTWHFFLLGQSLGPTTFRFAGLCVVLSRVHDPRENSYQ